MSDLHLAASEDELTDSDPDCSQNDDATEPRSTKRPKVVLQGAAIYKTKFNKEWSKIHPFIKEVKGNPHLVKPNQLHMSTIKHTHTQRNRLYISFNCYHVSELNF